MIITSYIVRVCDADPFLPGAKNVLPYKFASLRKAQRFAEDALSRGLFAVLSTVEWSREDE